MRSKQQQVKELTDNKTVPGIGEKFVKNWDKKPHERWDLQTVDKLTAVTRSRYKSWTFSMPSVSQERWDEIFGKKNKKEA